MVLDSVTQDTATTPTTFLISPDRDSATDTSVKKRRSGSSRINWPTVIDGVEIGKMLPPHALTAQARILEKLKLSKLLPHHLTFCGEVAAELFEEDVDGNGYSDEAGKYI